ncbi:MAG TPA: hypothetical protein VD788_05920 [Candidatus Polarisedimenticolaceae bacterium]|nr:hypothetical protein [Candidatus Polarisedimenticolaceae bacterium]
MPSHRTSAIPILLAVTAAAWAPAAGGTFEDSVRSRWRGAWVVLGTEVYSTCDGAYHANRVSRSLVAHRGGMRFLPGELGEVQRVQLKKRKVELMIALDVPLRVAAQDGPFTLYDHRPCAISLEIEVPRDATAAQDVQAVDRIAAGVARRFDTREDAMADAGWNARQPEPLPPDHDLTVARHARWKAEQTNASVDGKREAAVDQARLAGTTIDDDPSYLAGLAAGVEQMRGWQERDCARLMTREFDALERKAPEPQRSDHRWLRGFADGQRLVYYIELIDRLESCYLPLPPLPVETAAEASASLERH